MGVGAGGTEARAEGLLSHARELERRDEATAAQIAAIVDLAERADGVRSRAVAVAGELDAIPGEAASVASAERDAREAERVAHVELAEAERRLAEVEGSRRARAEDLDRARRAALDAREAVADAEARVARLVARQAELQTSERELRTEAEALAAAAREVAVAIAALPRVSDGGKADPGSTLAELDDWGGRARAALFVVRGTLAQERERIVVEAEALGAAVLGEDLAGASVTIVRQRLERALG